MASLIAKDFANLQGQGLDLGLISTLAGLGAAGSSPQHCHNDMLSRIPPPSMPNMKFMKIPLEHAVFGASSAISGVMWPHEVFSMMFHLHNEAFFTYIMPSVDIIRNFWNSVKGYVGLSYMYCLVYCPWAVLYVFTQCVAPGVHVDF